MKVSPRLRSTTKADIFHAVSNGFERQMAARSPVLLASGVNSRSGHAWSLRLGLHCNCLPALRVAPTPH
jgi:hypothetical protein